MLQGKPHSKESDAYAFGARGYHTDNASSSLLRRPPDVVFSLRQQQL